MTSKNIRSFQWKRIIFFFLGLLFMAALVPWDANAEIKGSGTQESPYWTDKNISIKIFQCDKGGTKIGDALGGDRNGDGKVDSGDKNEAGDILVKSGQKEKIYFLIEYENGTKVKGDDYLLKKKLDSTSNETVQVKYVHWKSLPNGTKVNNIPLPAKNPFFPWSEIIELDFSDCNTPTSDVLYNVTVALCGANTGLKDTLVAWKTGFSLRVKSDIPITGLDAWTDAAADLGSTGYVGEDFTRGGIGPLPWDTTETDYTITVESSNDAVVADDEIKVELVKPQTKEHRIIAPMKKGGKTELTVVLTTKDGKVFRSKPMPVTVRSHRQDYNTGFIYNILPIGIEASLADKYQIYPSTVDQSMKWTSSDPSVISVDTDGNLNVLSVGKATITATSNYDPSIVMTWDLIADRPELYLDGKKLTEDTVLIDGEKTSGDLKVCYSTRPDDPLTWLQHFSSNTDVATYASTYGDTLNFHKNGTVDVYLYDRTTGNEETMTYLVGHTTFKVTGKAEDARESSWTALTDAQIFDGNLNATQYAYHQLTSHPVESNTLNKAWFQNQITNRIPADEAVFTFRLGNRNPDPNLNEAKYLSSLYDKVTIRRVEDGRLGAVVASCNQGYTVESVKTEYGTSGQGTGVKEVIPTIKVDKGILERGKDYALVIDRRAEAPCGADLLMDADYRFTTVGPAKTVHLDKTEAVLKPGESLTLTATMNKDEKVEADDSIVWKSSAPAIAEVDQQGKVTAKAPGKADIIAEAKYGKVKAVCKLTVEPIKATGVTVNAKSFTLTKGQSRQLTATVSPENASYKTVTWTSSNKKAVRVDEKGKVTAVSAGNATVTAKTKDGKYAKVTVKVRPKNTSFRLYGKRKEAVVKYNSVPGADGYRIYYAKTKNGKYKIADTRTPKEEKRFSHKKLKAKRTYYYKMRTYEVVKGKRIYSELSQPKKVRTK